MTPDQAYAQLLTHAGQSVSVDGADAKKCTAIAHLLQQISGNGLILGNAVDTLANAKNNPAYNTGTTWPAPKGACVVFGAPYGLVDGTYYGHTGVSRGDGVLFEQNDPDGSTAHEKVYAPAGFIGWFIPKNLIQGDAPMNVENTSELQLLIASILLRQPQSGDDGYVGQNIWQVVTEFENSGEHQTIVAKVNAYDGLVAQIAQLEAAAPADNAQLQSAINQIKQIVSSVPTN